MVSPYPAISIGGAALRAVIPPAGIGTPGFFSANAGPSPFTQFADGLQNIAQNFAAGFARDPERRAEAMRQLQLSQQQQQAEADAKREQQRQRLDLLFSSYKSVVAGLQGVGTLPPSVGQLLGKLTDSMVQVSGDPNLKQPLLDWAQAIAQTPQTVEPKLQNVIGPNGENLGIVNAADPNAVTQLPAGARLAGEVAQPQAPLSQERFQQEQQLKPVSNVNIQNVGTIPPEYQLTKDVTTGALRMEKIPGGPSEEKAAQRQAEKQTTTDIVTENIDRSLKIVESAQIPVTGFIGAYTQAIPGTPAYDLKQNIQTIRANVSIDKLQQMRNNSPTGGGLGNVSNYEDQLLSASLGALEQSQSKEQFVHNLNRVRQIYNQIVNGPEGLPKIGEVRKGYIYKGGDPADPMNWDKAP